SSVANGAEPLLFAWRKDGVLLASEATSTLNLTNVSTNDAGVYTLEVSGACGQVTNSALLTVRELTTAAPLADAVVCVGNPVSFSTVPAGTGPFTFVWRKDGVALDGETNATLSIASATSESSGVYTVEVSGACDSVTNSATLILNVLVTATPLTDAIVCPGETVSFTTTAEGAGPFAFVWRKDGGVIGGAIEATLIISNASLADAGSYAVEVHGAYNVVTNSAVLMVRDLVTATPLLDASRCAGDSMMFNTAPAGTPPMTFAWRKDGVLLPSQTNSSLSIGSLTTNDAGIYSVEVAGVCNVVTNSASLVINALMTATPPAGVLACEGSTASFASVISGAGPFTFAWRKDGILLPNATNASLDLVSVTVASSGTYTLEAQGVCRAITNSATLVVTALPTALTNESRCPGGTATFSTTVNGGGLYSFVWRKDGTLLNDQTNSILVLTNVQATHAGTYSVEVTGGCVLVTNSAVLSVPPTTLLAPMASQSQCAGATVIFTANASGLGPFQYVWRKGGTVMAGSTGAVITLTNVTVADAAEYSVEVTGVCGSATNSATLSVSTAPAIAGFTDVLICAGQDVLLAPAISGSGTYTNIWRRNGVLLEAETNATLLIVGANTANAGAYSIEVSGSCGSLTQSVTLTLRTNLTLAPLADLSRSAGSSVTFTAIVSGAVPLSFVWKKDSGVIASATSNWLTLTNLGAADEGVYSVEVSGPCNTAAANATLTVNSAATAATPLQNSSVCPGQAVTFGTSASGCGEPFTFVWRKDGQIMSGQTNSTLTIPNPTLTNAGTYSVEVIGCNRVTNTAQLTVSAPLSATMPAQKTACSCSDVVLGPTILGGTGPFTCVWRKDGVLLSDQTNMALNLQKLNTASAGTYTAEISGPCNNVTNSTVLEIINTTSGLWPNTNAMVIPEFGGASPYPSTVFVRCAPVPVTELRVTLFGVSHTFPDDIDVLLVSPNNIAVKLMSDCGGGGANILNNVTLVFDSAATTALPDSGQIVAGTFRPTDYNGLDGDTFPAPAPAGTPSLSLGSFFGSDPNGTWSLYVVDDHGRDGGGLKGWSLDFGQSAFTFPNVVLTNPEMNEDGSFTMQLRGTPDKMYYLEASTDMKQWTIIQTNHLTGPSMTITDRTAPQFQYRFYRASGCRD
ncbi:MAG TPA: hypothetical protein VK846_16815, partial [Candidatus Limnocylindria bacterium]|nr:hypothetical protein [Candidatus Limnocylindria bacterium]